MIIFYPSHVFTSHFVAQCKSFMKPKLGYFYEYNILYAKPTFRRLFFRKKWTKYKQVLYHSDALCLDFPILLSSCAKFVLNPQHRRAKLTNFPSHQTSAQQWGILRNFWLHCDGGIYDFADPACYLNEVVRWRLAIFLCQSMIFNVRTSNRKFYMPIYLLSSPCLWKISQHLIIKYND